MKKRIKVVVILLASICLMMACTFTLTGCKNIEDSFISDGDFQFYYVKEDDCYAVVGLTEQGKANANTLIIPAYYRDKTVDYTHYYYEFYGILSNHTEYYFARVLANKIYYPYTATHYRPFSCMFAMGIEGKIFFANSSVYRDAATQARMSDAQYYVTPKAYERIMGDLKDAGDINIANTAFMFNYGGEPNDGYFFINDFERGGTIEDTPYEPKRDGYTFGGWYKESECVNAWNFAEDTLPEAEYDEEGNLIFVETRLYAKWFKN